MFTRSAAAQHRAAAKVPTDSQLQLCYDSMLAANAMQLFQGSSTGLQQWQEQQREQQLPNLHLA